MSETILLGELVERMKLMEETLRFYADPSNYPEDVLDDEGDMARISLEFK